MRRLLVPILLLALAVPSAAAARRFVPGDGTLSVRNGDGRVQLALRGSVIGKVGDGTLTIIDPENDDCDAPLVWEVDSQRRRVLRPSGLGERRIACVYEGENMRFRLVGGQHDLRLSGVGISLSAVGRGVVFLKGAPWANDGVFSVNGDAYSSLPDDGAWFRIRTPASATP